MWDGHPEWPSRNMKKQNTPGWVADFLNLHSKAQGIADCSKGIVKIPKRIASHDFPRPFIRHAEHQPSTAFIRERGAIVDQLLKIELVAGAFELKMMIFLFQEELLQLD